jgi:hypothetical protein
VIGNQTATPLQEQRSARAVALLVILQAALDLFDVGTGLIEGQW